MRRPCLALALVLAGCATPVPEPAPREVPVTDAPAAPLPSEPAAPEQSPDSAATVRLQCDNGAELRVTFGDDEVRVSGLQGGEQVLLRDAGGTTPRQSVYTGSAMRAEFGLGPDARDAELQFLDSPARVRCTPR